MDITSYLLGKKASGSSKGLKVEVVQELPTTGEDNVLYLVPKTTTGTNNVFEEYLWIDNNWELIGTTDIDLSGYQTIANLVTSLNNQSTDTQYPSAKCVYDLLSTSSACEGISTTDYSNPFVFNGKKKGLYVFKNPSTFYYKTFDTDTTKSFDTAYVFALYITNDINVSSTNYDIGFGFYQTRNYNGLLGELRIATINMFWGTFSIGSSNYFGNLMMNNTAQTFSGVKTFSSIPKQSTTTAPTQDAEFTNKKYVDDSITSAIGTALGGSY